jgi:predicted esterase
MLSSTSIVAAHILAVLAPALFAGEAQVGAPEKPAAAAKPVTTVKSVPTRADLARAYLRFETALKENAPAAERVADINRAFDKLTLDFFMGNGAAAVKALDALTEELDPRASRTPASRLARALAVRVTPRTLRAGDALAIEVTARLVYELPADLAPETTLVFTAHARSKAGQDIEGAAATASATAAALTAGAGSARWTLNARRWIRPKEATSMRITLAIGTDPEVTVAEIPFLDRTLDSVRDSNEARIAAVHADDPTMQQAVATCLARNALLATEPSENDSSQFLADAGLLVRDIESEIEKLEQGQDPYRRRAGDLWRVVRAGSKDLPVRVFAPDCARSDDKLPLVVALHGAGGDENMFFDGYGAGRIKEIARSKGFLVVTPRVGFAGLDATAFDAIVQAMIYDYAVDPKRIYVIGHSMGAGAAFALASARSDRIAAACCIAGGPMGAPPKVCAPMLVYAGELDPMAGASALEKGVLRMKDAKLDVEFRRAQGYGHTLVVGEKLPEIVDWLLAKSR